MRTTRAFTLLELLVVVAIIALLISITMPSLKAVRRAGKSAKCKNNLHGIGVAMESYFSSSRDLFPCMASLPSAEADAAEDQGRDPYDPMPKVLWRHAYNSEYTGENKKAELFECPADEVLKDDPGYHQIGIFPGRRYFDTEATSYEWNILLNPDIVDDKVGPQKRRSLQVATIFDAILRANALSRTEMIRDFDLFHAPRGSNAAVNCLYGDLHVASY